MTLMRLCNFGPILSSKFIYHSYLQVSFPPYIFEILLNGLIEDESSKARIDDGMILLTLKKQSEGLWGELCSPVMGK